MAQHHPREREGERTNHERPHRARLPGPGEHHDEGHIDHGGLILSEYSQQDAEFTGYEIEIGTRVALPRGELELTLGRDEVDAESGGT